MVCQHCHQKQATVYYSQNVNGKVTEENLCAECAKKRNVGMMSAFDFSDLFTESFVSRRIQNRIRDRWQTLDNMIFKTFPNFELSGRDKDYARETTEPIILQVPAEEEFSAKDVLTGKKEEQENSELKTLKEQLKIAIRMEEYEKAAEIRDRIKEKKGKGVEEI